MLKIGELSKIKGISTKTLRHYDKIGLLRPMRVDSQTTIPPEKENVPQKGVLVLGHEYDMSPKNCLNRFKAKREVYRNYPEGIRG